MPPLIGNTSSTIWMSMVQSMDGFGWKVGWFWENVRLILSKNGIDLNM